MLVGAWNTFFGYATFAALTWQLTGRVPRAYLFAYAIASVVAITSAFVLYKAFVFRTRGNALREFLRMNVVYAGTTLLGFVLLPVLVYLAERWLGPAWAPYAAQAVLVPVGTLAGFFGHRRFSFGGLEPRPVVEAPRPRGGGKP